MGLNAQGVFSAITNRPCAEPDPGLRSRGHVVLDALAAPNARAAADALRSLPSGAHNPFNLFVADEEAAFALVYEGTPELSELAPGAHVIGNADPDDRSHFKVGRTLERAERAAALAPAAALDALADVCREHEVGGSRGPLDDTCVHAGSYGTRSSMLLSLGENGDCRLQYAEGPPCQAKYEDFTSLLTELTQWEGYGAEGAFARTVT